MANLTPTQAMKLFHSFGFSSWIRNKVWVHYYDHDSETEGAILVIKSSPCTGNGIIRKLLKAEYEAGVKVGEDRVKRSLRELIGAAENSVNDIN